jgi:hypothetical protein
MKLKIFLISVMTLSVFSCDDFVDINKNPNQTTTSTPELVLSAALNATAGQLFFNQMGAFWAGQWCPSGDVSGFIAEKTYDLNNNYGTGIWTGVYDNLIDYKYIIDESKKSPGKTAVGAIARIMTALLYQRLVDTYGNVPYKDALKGTEVIRPAYDDAQSVYESNIEELDAAVAILKAVTDPEDSPKAADIMFGGDLTKWVKFANTLKLRMLIRQSAMPGRGAYITSEIAQISGGYLTEDANLTPGYLKTAGKLNPFWNNYFRNETDNLNNNFNFYRSTAFLVSNLPGTDARRNYIVAPQGSAVHPGSLKTFGVVQSAATPPVFSWAFTGARTGVNYGDETPVAYSAVTSGIGFGILKSFDMPMTLMTAAESYFLQCEAVQRSYAGGNAAALYDLAVTASFKTLNAETVSVNSVSGFPTVTSTPAVNAAARLAEVPYDGTIQRIITQKWVASVGYGGFEAWCDVRRTGFPNAPLSLRAIKPNPPVRLFYPNQEVQTNSASVAAQGAIDAITTKLFWDAN